MEDRRQALSSEALMRLRFDMMRYAWRGLLNGPFCLPAACTERDSLGPESGGSSSHLLTRPVMVQSFSSASGIK